MSEAGARSFITALRTGPSFTYAVLAAVTVAFGLYAVFVSAPATRAVAQEKLAQTIADETSAFCEKFGMRAGTREFLDCSAELAIIRQRQIERDRAAEQGIL